MDSLLIYLILLSVISSGITAVWIHSEIAEPFRDMWNWVFSYKHISFMQTLSYCTLCAGFWISLGIENFLFQGVEGIDMITFAFGSAFMTWLLNAIAQYYLWTAAKQKVIVEEYACLRDKED